MQKISKKLLGDFTVIEYSGKMLSCVGEAVTGRLCTASGRMAEACAFDDAKILVTDGESKISEIMLKNAVGVVLTNPKSICLTSDIYNLPVLLIQTDDINLDIEGKIAILDGKAQKIYINPNIEAISKVLNRSRESERTAPTRIFLYGGDKSTCVPDGFDGLAVWQESFSDEGTAYEYFCDIADKNTGIRLISKIQDSGDESIFISQIRAVYRAGVWGRFSILCGGISTPEKYQRCIYSLHSAFRELDGEGREFNGFIPKGMLVDTPLMLLFHQKFKAFDFYCLDIDAICKGFCHSESTESSIKHIYTYIENFAKSVFGSKIGIISKTEPSRELCDMLLRICGALDIYTGRKIF